MVPMHGKNGVETLDEPDRLPRGEHAFAYVLSVPLLGGVRGGFMVPMHGTKVVELNLGLLPSTS